MTASTTDTIAVLRIEIEDIEPLIWRRVAVRTSMNLSALHEVIQAIMGWLDYPLWEFVANESKYGILIPDDPDWNRRINNAANTKLSLVAGDRHNGDRLHLRHRRQLAASDHR